MKIQKWTLKLQKRTLEAKKWIFKAPNSKTLKRQSGGLNGGLEFEISLKVIEIISNNPSITQKELATEADIPLRTMQRIMKELQERGKIERKGGKRYGYWEVR